MSSAVIDTNILIYAANEKSEWHKNAVAFLKNIGKNDEIIFVWPVIYEFLRLVTHPKVFEHPLKFEQAWQFIITAKVATAASVLTETEIHDEILCEIAALSKSIRGNLFHDVHIATILKENGIGRIYTCDNDFNLFGFLKVINPLK